MWIARQWQIEELLRDFKWPLLGVLYGVDSTVINPSLEDMVAVVEGGNRLRLLKYMFPLGTYNEEHPLPKGKKLGDLVEIPVMIIDCDPVEAFIGYGNCDHISGNQEIRVKYFAGVAGNAKYASYVTFIEMIKQCGLDVDFDSKPGRRPGYVNNTVYSASQLYPYFKRSPQIFSKTLDVITSVYRFPLKTGVVEYHALSGKFMIGVHTLLENSPYAVSTIIKVLRQNVKDGWTAEAIVRNLKATGQGYGGRKLVAECLNQMVHNYMEK